MNNKEFKAVDFIRQVRNKISKDIQDFNYKQIKEYFAQKKNNRIIPILKFHKTLLIRMIENSTNKSLHIQIALKEYEFANEDFKNKKKPHTKRNEANS